MAYSECRNFTTKTFQLIVIQLFVQLRVHSVKVSVQITLATEDRAISLRTLDVHSTFFARFLLQAYIFVNGTIRHETLFFFLFENLGLSGFVLGVPFLFKFKSGGPLSLQFWDQVQNLETS